MKPTTFENLLNAVQNGFQWWSDNQARMDSRFTRRGWPETERPCWRAPSRTATPLQTSVIAPVATAEYHPF